MRRMLVLGILLAAAPAWADEPPSHRLHLVDGSVVAGRLEHEHVVVKTRYGDLTVPVVELHALTPGLDSHPAFTGEISDLIEKLGGESSTVREEAQNSLTDYGPKIRPLLLPAVKDADPERRARVQAILEVFDDMAAEAEEFGEMSDDDPTLPLIPGDRVRTAAFTAVGRAEPRVFALQSAYGTLRVRIEDLRHAELVVDHVVEPILRNEAVVAANVVDQNEKTTAVRVKRGDRVTLTASGTITLTPWGSNATSTPEGRPASGWYEANEIPMGALVGRIGTGGAVFKIGTKHTFTAKRSGRLRLGFAMKRNYSSNTPFPGQYRVKIRVDPK